MTFSDPQSRLTDDQVELVKRQLTPVLRRMTRKQVFELGDHLYSEARLRCSEVSFENWTSEISV